MRDFLGLEPGAVALLCLRREELPRLNLVRPIAQQRGLKLLLMPLESQGGVAAARNDAPDFLDWCSYVVEADDDVPEVVRAGIDAAKGVLPAVVWQGPPVCDVLDQLGVVFDVLSAKRKHDELDAALRASSAEAIVWTDAEDRYERRRIEWVLALSERRPQLSLTEGVPGVRDWVRADARVVDPWTLLEEGRERWSIAVTGGAAAGSVDAASLKSSVGATSLPEETRLDAARLAMDESHLDTAEFALVGQTEATVLLARLLDARGRYEEAEAAYEEALGVKEEVYGTRRHGEIAATLHGLGNVYESRGKYEEAEAAYEEALGVTQEVYGTRRHAEVAATLHGLGNVYESRGKYEEAEAAYEEALEIETTVFGGMNVNSLPTLQNLAGVQLQLGKVERVAQSLAAAWAFAERERHVNHMVQIAPRYLMALRAQGERESFECVRSSARAALEQLPATHPIHQRVEAAMANIPPWPEDDA